MASMASTVDTEPSFISQLFLHSCTIKSGSSLGTEAKGWPHSKQTEMLCITRPTTSSEPMGHIVYHGSVSGLGHTQLSQLEIIPTLPTHTTACL